MQKKKPAKGGAKTATKKKPLLKKGEGQEKFSLKRLLFGEEKPDLSELEAGSTTILDILSPTAIDTKSRDYILVDGVYHAYLYVAGYGYSTTVGSCWLAPLVEAGEGVSLSFTVRRQSKEKILSKISQTTVNANVKMSIFAETKCNFSPVSTQVYTALIHHITCRLEARQALIYQLVLGLTGENGKYNYSRAVHLYPPFFDISCSAKNYKIAPALTPPW